MRILNISSLYPPYSIGGAEQGLCVMSEEMAKKGHEIHIVTLQPPEPAFAAKEAINETVQVHRLPLTNLYWPFQKTKITRRWMSKTAWHLIDTDNRVMAQKVARLVAKINPDIVLTRNLQGFSTAVIPAVKSLGFPVIHVLHDVALLCPKTTMYKNNQRCGMKDLRCGPCKVLTRPRWRHLKNVDGVIGVSAAILKAHTDHGLFANTYKATIHNALNPSLNPAPSVVRKALTERFTLGYMGRIEKSKGVETMMSAAELLMNKGFVFRLRFAGRGNECYLDLLKRKWPLLDIEFLGHQDPVKYLPKIDVLVFPSIAWEALGNGVFESFSQGVPVIGSDVGGIPEMIEPSKNGLVFKAGSVLDLAKKIESMMASPGKCKSMGLTALRKSECYKVENRASQYYSRRVSA